MKSRLYFTLVILLSSFVLIGCGYKIDNKLNLSVSNFDFTNQDNESISLSDFKGKVWIADFIFTNCTTVCIPMMSNMVSIQEQLKEKDLDVDFVSFSVDPEYDTPEVLKTYAAEFNANLASWHFLTGYTQLELEEFAMSSFKTYAKKPEDHQVIHGTSFFLVDQYGVVVKEFSGLNTPIDEITKDINYLIAKE